MRRLHLTAVAFGLLAITLVACKSGRRGPTEPPEPALPRGTAQATALENLPLILDLERIERMDTRLVAIVASGVDIEGAIRTGNAWSYIFADTNDRRYFWSVWWDGRIDFRGPEPPIVIRSFDHLPDLIRLDSDALTQLALQHGGDRFLEKFPDGFVSMEFYVLAGIATCEMKFFNPGGSNFCEPEVYIDAGTGDLLQTAGFECLDGA